jgi:hypothetical protein
MSNIQEIKIPTMPTFMPLIKHDYPITERENLMRALNRQKPMWMPNLYRSSQLPPWAAYNDMPDSMEADGSDWFGIQYQYSAAQGSPTPITHAFSEIGEWREKIAWPDLDNWDWLQGADGFVRDERFASAGLFGNGLFERLHIFEGFEQALVDLISEPEECRAFFEKLADYKIDVFRRMNDIYHYDYVVYNDDWGTARAPFFSLDLFEATVYEPTIRVVRAMQEGGAKVIFHNCGLIDSFIPHLVNDIRADALEIQTLNDIKGILQNYGDRVTVEYHADQYLMYDPETTPEQARRHAREIVDTYGAHVNPGAGVMISAGAFSEEVFYAFEDEIFNYSLEKYKDLA